MKKSKYNNLINNKDRIVLVDFYADWCGPCKNMEPVLNKIAKTHGKEVAVYKINIDKNQSLASELGIRSIPFLSIYKNGKQVWKHTGGLTYGQLNNQLEYFNKK